MHYKLVRIVAEGVICVLFEIQKWILEYSDCIMSKQPENCVFQSIFY